MINATPAKSSDARVTLDLRSRVETFKGSAQWDEVSVARPFSPDETAVLVCDVWDTHWCRTAAERTDELAVRIDALAKAARRQGVQIVHSPSNTLDFYAPVAQRQRTVEAYRVDPPKPIDLPDPPLPIDDSDGGCDTGECAQARPWTRQHPTIEIAESDAISDDGLEVYSVLHRRGIKTLLFTGVHTNMCVLNRSFGIKQMTRWGVECVLIRDLTDTMYNPKRAPYVSHDEGTELVIEHIERHWCPTVTSAELMPLLKG